MGWRFRPFTHGTAVPRQAGLGLCHCIASEMARFHGATLEASSEDQGTKLTLRLPAGAA